MNRQAERESNNRDEQTSPGRAGRVLAAAGSDRDGRRGGRHARAAASGPARAGTARPTRILRRKNRGVPFWNCWARLVGAKVTSVTAGGAKNVSFSHCKSDEMDGFTSAEFAQFFEAIPALRAAVDELSSDDPDGELVSEIERLCDIDISGGSWAAETQVSRECWLNERCDQVTQEVLCGNASIEFTSDLIEVIGCNANLSDFYTDYNYRRDCTVIGFEGGGCVIAYNLNTKNLKKYVMVCLIYMLVQKNII